MFVLALASAGAIACSSSPPTQQAPEMATPATQPKVYKLSNNWGNGLGCTPEGEELTVTGTLVVRPFGKGTDGAVVKTDSEEWVVSYRATGALLELAGKRVVARGRQCSKQGESVAGRHLDLATLTEAP